MDVHIRQALPAELESLAFIEFENRRVMIDNPVSPDEFIAPCLTYLRSSLSHGTLFVCLDTEGLAGHYSYTVSPSGSEVSLDSVQVARRRRSQGIGEVLIDDFLSRASSSIAPIKALVSIHPASPGVQVYLSKGFSVSSKSPSRLLLSKTLERLPPA